MGHPIKHSPWFRLVLCVVLIVSIGISINAFYPEAQNTLRKLNPYSIEYYTYKPRVFANIEVQSVSSSPALAVPMLMYHGVNTVKDDTNTTIKNFIQQLELLKQSGFTTISVAEYDQFRQGTFTLPPKPIIISFDDGRKDSYYTTDDVLKKLNFKATMFVATAKANNKDPFYLDWNDLRTLRDSGRWEIEAHGRDSHAEIPLVKNASDEEDWGRFLNSKMYLEDKNRLETTEEFEARVEADYLAGLQDIKINLGLDAQYYAIPLNDYGQQEHTNYEEAIPFNQKVIRKYFKMAFIEANDPSNVTTLRLPVYNYKDTDPYFIRRIEVKNMSALDLVKILHSQAPISPDLVYANTNFVIPQNGVTDAEVTIQETGLHIKTIEPDQSGKVLFGEDYWENYSVTANIDRIQGASTGLLLYYKDAQNYVAFGLSGNYYFLRSTVQGVTKDLVPPFTSTRVTDKPIEFKVEIKNGKITTYVNGYHLFRNVSIKQKGGKAGIKIWDLMSTAHSEVSSLTIAPAF
ncbi:MAG: polysaccharide deacetylase family protein [Patescibacteria group bacterium]